MVMQYVVVGVVVFAAVVYCVMKIVRTIKRAAQGGGCDGCPNCPRAGTKCDCAKRKG